MLFRAIWHSEMAKLHSASPRAITPMQLYPNYTQKHVITYTNNYGGSLTHQSTI